MFRDAAFALRQLAKAPGFTVVALVTLALGIGSATIVFSAVNAYLLRPLPYIQYDEDRLLYATEIDKAHRSSDYGWNYPDYAALRLKSTTLASIWIHTDFTVILAGKTQPERLVGTSITWDGFAGMGIAPKLGRLFDVNDIQPNAPRVALISHALWQRRFGGDEEVIDSVATLNGQRVAIVGVMPEGWRYPEFSDVWMPVRGDDEKLDMRGDFYFQGRARLKPGVTLAEAQTEVDAIMGALAKEFPATNRQIAAKLMPIREEAVGKTAHLTLLLFGAVFFVFLISCVNVANLLLSRAVNRAKEMSIRLAMGAERQRLIRQLVTESLVLTLIGGAAGMLVGLWGNDALCALIPVDLPFWLRFDFDGRVFAFVLILSIIAALAVGLFPAFKASKPDVVVELKEGGRGEAGGSRATRLRNFLVVAEIALALVLLVGAGLMMRSFLHLRSIEPGFDASNVLTFRAGFPSAMIEGKFDRPAQFFQALPEKLTTLPGVKAVGLINELPGKSFGGVPIRIEGRPEPKTMAELPVAAGRIATSGYFAAVRIPLKAGRLFDDRLDRTDTPRVAVVDEEFAKKYFGCNDDAIGKRIALAKEHLGKPSDWAQIVGVVGKIRHRLDRSDYFPTAYLSYYQEPVQFMSVVMQTHSDPASYITAARDAVLSVNREIPIYYALTLDQVLLQTIWPSQFFGYLFTIFGIIALFLACIGIYGVMSYNVSQRTQELGVRMALGAQSREVMQLVIRHGLRLVGWGLGVGFVSAAALANVLAGVLYGVSPHDPPTFAVVPLLLAIVALAACWLPGQRATRVSPIDALRSQ